MVRGAYLERERFLAETNGYEDPVHPTYELTGKMYNQVINHMIAYVGLDFINALIGVLIKFVITLDFKKSMIAGLLH